MLEEVKNLIKLQSKDLVDFELSAEEFQAWETMPTTQKIMRCIYHNRQAVVEELALGASLQEDATKTAQHTAFLVGLVEGYDTLLKLEYYKETEETDDQ